MTLVTVDSSVLDTTTMIAVVGLGFVIAFIILIIYVIYNRYRTPKEALDLKKASNQGKLALLTVGVDNLADIMPMNDFIHEGIKESVPIGKGAKKSWLRFKIPRAEQAPDSLTVEDGKRSADTVKVLQTLLNLNNEKVFLRKAKIPLLVGVKNSVAAVSLKFLGVQSFLNKIERLQKDGHLYPQIVALKQSAKFNELGLLLEELSTGISVIDFPQVYARAASTVGQTDIDSMRERDQTIGRREGKDDKEKGTKNMLLYFGFAMAGLAAVIAVVYFFGGK